MSMARLSHTLGILLLFLLLSCKGGKQLVAVESSTLELSGTANAAEDSAVLKLIQPYKTVIDKEMNEVLIQSDQPLTKGEPEGALGSFIADIILSEGNKRYGARSGLAADFCMLNNGGLRIALPMGAITKGHIFELMPFENEIVVITLSGAKTKDLLDYVAARNGVPVAGLKMGIKDKVLTKAEINGQPFDPNKSYRIITSDYLAGGGDKMGFFKDAQIETLNYKIRDAIIDYLREEGKKGKSINYTVDGRIYYEQ